MTTRGLDLFASYNRTELIQTCQGVGISVSPSASREELVELLLGDSEEPTSTSDLDAWRHGIMGFILDHWATLSTQLTCPAKTKDPRACFGCIDAQVVSCLNSNQQYIEQIAQHKREERPHSMSTDNQPLMIDNAPRTLEGLTALPFTEIRRLLKQLEAKGIHLSDNEDEKRAFYALKDNGARAQKVLELLNKYDAPQAAAAAPPKKSPATRKQAAAAASDNAASPVAFNAAEGGATQIVDLTPVLDLIKAVLAAMNEQAKTLAELNDRVEAIGAMGEVTVGTATLVMEQTLNNPKEALFTDVIAAATEVHALMEEASRGK